MDYLLEAVGKRELFGLLRLEPEKWWHGLLFRDRYNMLGIAASIPQAVQDSLSQHPGALTQVSLLVALMAMVLGIPAPQCPRKGQSCCGPQGLCFEQSAP